MYVCNLNVYNMYLFCVRTKSNERSAFKPLAFLGSQSGVFFLN